MKSYDKESCVSDSEKLYFFVECGNVKVKYLSLSELDNF